MKPEPSRRQAFVELISEHQRILHRLCNVYSREATDRDDLYQEMVMQAWRSFDSFNGRSKFSTWLYRVALNTALLKKRRDAAWRKRVAVGDPPEAAIEADCDRIDDMELLYGCIQELSKVDRAIIFLHLEHHSYDEIAEITGLSRSNVSVRIVRIKKKLRELLIARGGREE